MRVGAAWIFSFGDPVSMKQVDLGGRSKQERDRHVLFKLDGSCGHRGTVRPILAGFA